MFGETLMLPIQLSTCLGDWYTEACYPTTNLTFELQLSKEKLLSNGGAIVNLHFELAFRVQACFDELANYPK